MVDGPTYGVGLVSRFPVRGWWIRRFRAAPFRLPLLVPMQPRPRLVPVPDEPRLAIAALIEGPSGPFTVVTTHLSFVPGYNVRQLRSLTRWVARMPGPVFLLGDLNLPGTLPSLVTGWRQLARQPTYPADGPRVQFDHVLAHGSAEPVDAQALVARGERPLRPRRGRPGADLTRCAESAQLSSAASSSAVGRPSGRSTRPLAT